MSNPKKPLGMKFFFLSFGLIIPFIFSGQTQRVQQKPIQKIPLKERAIKAPKIVLERAPLESPKGMRIFETKVLAVRADLIKKFTAERKFLATPLILNVQPTIQEEVYQESEKKFTRLMTDKARGHMILLSHAEKTAQTKVRLLNRDAALNKALEHVNALQLVPKDESKIAPKHVITLSKAELKQGGTAVSADVLQTVSFQRMLDEKPVVGRGSQLFLDLGDQGQLEGLNRTWNQLVPSKIAAEFRTDKDIYDEVEKTLAAQLRGDVTVRVNKLRLVYSGDDRRFVQPAYFYSAEISAPNAQGKGYSAGVVAALKNPPEPVVLVKDASRRIMPQQAAGSPGAGSDAAPALEDDPTVGRYVVRDDSWDWVDDAADFRDGLLSGRSSSSPAITFGDYYWDEPRLWKADEGSFVDKWHIALMEGHGANWLFTTRSDCCDVVLLNSGTQPGYGNRAGDSMRFLILKGCSIVPAPPDRANWPDPWWRIFKGLRQAVGFRTSMYINDNIAKHFGKHLGENCRVLDSWFHATNECSSYQWERFWGSSGNEVYGYGTMVMIPGHEGDGVYATAAAPAATTTGLTIWWQH